MNSRAVITVMGIGVLCSCTNQAPSVSDLALEQSALTSRDRDRSDDVDVLKAVLFGVGRSTLVDRFWDRASLSVRSDPSYVEFAEAVVLEVTRRYPDLGPDLNRAIARGEPRAITREIERAQESIAEVVRDGSAGDSATERTIRSIVANERSDR